MEQVDMFDTDKVKFRDKVRRVFRRVRPAVEETAGRVYKADATRAFGTAVKETIVDAIRSDEFRIMVVWMLLMSLLGGWLIGAWHLGAIIGSVIGLAKILSPR